MKRIILITLTAFSGLAIGQASHTITASGLNYVPDSLTVSVGDTIVFAVGASHPTTEVSQATWNANGSTALAGGFSFPSGSGAFVASNAQTYYYICDNHIGAGMKGLVMASNTVSSPELRLSQLSLYPNPAREAVTLQLPNQHPYQQLRLYGPGGQLVAEFELSGRESLLIELKALPAGSYIFQLDSPGIKSELRFVKAP